MVDINKRIDLLSKQIKRNEKEQDKFIVAHGYMDNGLLKVHDELCDKMDVLTAIRRGEIHE